MILKFKYAFLGIIAMLIFTIPVEAAPVESGVPYLQYRAHVSEIGWMDYVDSGMVGTVGKSLPMEAFQIKVLGNEQIGVEYQVHVSEIGWMQNVIDGNVAGTTGRALSMEAVRIDLTGELANCYDIYYRAHVAELGWLGWAKNGEEAGSTGYAYSLQALDIVLLPEGQTPEDYNERNAFREKLRFYQTAHVSEIGWMDTCELGTIVGTTGRGLSLEAIKLNSGIEGVDVSYSVHVSEIGWMDEVRNGTMAGTVGRALSIEAIKIRLTGSNSDKYDIYYRAHISEEGWLDWTKNGNPAGSEGRSCAMQALEIRIVYKGDVAPGSTACAYLAKPSIEYKSLVGDLLWQNYVKDGNTSGTTGKSMPLRAVVMSITNMDSLGIEYSVHISDIGWQKYISSGKMAGLESLNNNIEAIRIRLTGSAAKYYDVWYRVHSANFGWLDWTCNGDKAGTATLGYDAQAIQVVICAKGSVAPGTTSRPYVDTVEERYLWPLPSSTRITSYFGYRSQPTAGASTYHQGIDIGAAYGANIIAVKSGTVTECAYNNTRGYYIEITHDDGVKTIYMHMSRQAVSEGMKVSRGQTIGYVGSTGISTGPHLHLSVVVNGNNVNPLDYVSF